MNRNSENYLLYSHIRIRGNIQILGYLHSKRDAHIPRKVKYKSMKFGNKTSTLLYIYFNLEK